MYIYIYIYVCLCVCVYIYIYISIMCIYIYNSIDLPIPFISQRCLRSVSHPSRCTPPVALGAKGEFWPSGDRPPDLGYSWVTKMGKTPVKIGGFTTSNLKRTPAKKMKRHIKKPTLNETLLFDLYFLIFIFWSSGRLDAIGLWVQQHREYRVWQKN